MPAILIPVACALVWALTGLRSIDASSAPAGRFCSVRDAQTELNVSKPTVHRLIASGQLAGGKLGRKRLVVRDSLDALASRLAAGEDITTNS